MCSQGKQKHERPTGREGKKMKRYNPTAEILNAITALDAGEKIRAYFKNGREAVYTMSIFDLLKTDPAIQFITSEETGEIIYSA